VSASFSKFQSRGEEVWREDERTILLFNHALLLKSLAYQLPLAHCHVGGVGRARLLSQVCVAHIVSLALAGWWC
jgi:hypothetical protein